jgi:hypothetical protein
VWLAGSWVAALATRERRRGVCLAAGTGGVFLGLARWRWQRARAAHRAAARIERDDLEAATVATESWLGLVRTRTSVLAGDERLVQETLALAIELLESGQSHAPLRRRLPG